MKKVQFIENKTVQGKTKRKCYGFIDYEAKMGFCMHPG